MYGKIFVIIRQCIEKIDKKTIYLEQNFVVFTTKFCSIFLCSFSQKGYTTVTDSCRICVKKP